MPERLNQIEMNAEIVIGEGKKDDSFGLFEGEYVGHSELEEYYDIAVDPVDGTTQCAKGGLLGYVGYCRWLSWQSLIYGNLVYGQNCCGQRSSRAF